MIKQIKSGIIHTVALSVYYQMSYLRIFIVSKSQWSLRNQKVSIFHFEKEEKYMYYASHVNVMATLHFDSADAPLWFHVTRGSINSTFLCLSQETI